MEAYTSTLGLLTDSLTNLSTYCFFISFEACPRGCEAFRYCVIVIIVSKFCETELGLPMQSRQTQLFRGGISFNTGGSFFTSWMWRMSPGRLSCPRTWNNIIFFFHIPSRKLGKNVNLFHINMNFF